jgi:hypothetical protein
MLGKDIKYGVKKWLYTTHNRSGRGKERVRVVWWEKDTAAVARSEGNRVIYFPNLVDEQDYSANLFDCYLGYALHELGHVWYTDNEPWDWVYFNQTRRLYHLVNGLEDVRIEKKIIDSGLFPNSKYLFERTINYKLWDKGYVKPNALHQMPFLVAVEGRRLNGYQIKAPSVLDRALLRREIWWGLKEARKAENTEDIVRTATELQRRLEELDYGYVVTNCCMEINTILLQRES